METFTIHNYLEIYSRNGGDFGRIFIKLGDVSFPDENWTDFGRKIVSWWLEQIRKLWAGEEKIVECRFMDGPYYFTIEIINDEIWNVRLVEERNQKIFVSEGKVFADELTKNLLSSVEDVVRIYETEGSSEVVKNFVKYKKKFLSDWKNSQHQ